MSTKAKERRAALDDLLTARASAPATDRPALAPRHMGPIAEQAGVLVAHVASRAKLYDDAKSEGLLMVRLDPKKIRATKFRNRHDKSLLADDAKFIELKDSIGGHGQDTPIRVRPVKDALPFGFEIVAGHRRHAACLALDTEREGGFSVLAMIDAKAGDSRDLVMKMYRENQHFDLSAYERGCMFSNWLEAGLYESQRDIAAAIGLGESAIGKYVAIAALPPAVLAAFGDVRAIPMSWHAPLTQALKSDEAAVLKVADKLCQRKPPVAADLVLKALVAAAAGKGHGNRGTSREESVRIGGRVPLKVGSGRNRIILKLAHLDEGMQKQLREELKDWAEAWLRKRMEPQ